MATKYRTIEQVLLEGSFLTPRQLEHAQFVNKQTGERLEDILVRLEYLNEEQLLEVWSIHQNCTIVDLETYQVDLKVVNLLPQSVATQYKALPLKKGEKGVLLALADPYNILALDFLRKILGAEIEIVLASRTSIETAIHQYYGHETTEVAEEGAAASAEQLEGSAVKFLDAIFRQALRKGASDIHVEPDQESFIVRMRIDGILHDIMFGPPGLLPSLVSRVKILARMDITQTRLPQDGRLMARLENQDVSFRVSTVPTLRGEKAVLRILQTRTRYDLESLGFTPGEYESVCRVLRAPYGMILVTGPTGSGKTTTLAAMLEYLNTPAINIFTIEDPIEYKVRRITQVQTDEKIGLSFAMGLRTALRQDPNVIMVGEIRDLETAEVGLRAALTGHRVLSTLHTNNAPATISRLVNMGCPGYLVSASLTLVISQKLIHTICADCREEYVAPPEMLERLSQEEGMSVSGQLFQGRGCVRCHYTGFRGRQPIFEVMVVDDRLRREMLHTSDEVQIRRAAMAAGMEPLRRKALKKAIEGVTTLSEVFAATNTGEGGSAAASGAAGGRDAGGQDAGASARDAVSGPDPGPAPVAGTAGVSPATTATVASMHREIDPAVVPRQGRFDKTLTPRPAWRATEETLQFIRANFGKLSDEEIADHLGLSVPQVQMVAERLSLKRSSAS